MDFYRLLTLLRRRLPLLAGGVVIGAILSFAVSSLLPRTYTATATLLVYQTTGVGNVQLGDLMASERLAQTYASLLTRRPVVSDTIAALNLTLDPETLAKQIKVTLVQNTQLLEVHVSDGDPARAAAIANKLTETFVAQATAIQNQGFRDAEAQLDSDLTANETNRVQTQQQLDTLKQVAAPSAAQQAEILRLTGVLTQLDATRDSLLQSAASVRQTEATTSAPVQLADPAAVPSDPTFPRTSLNVVLAALAGLLLAAGLAWLLEYLDNTLRTPEAVQAALALPTLAQVRRTERAPVRRRVQRGAEAGAGADALVTRDAGRSEAAESYRHLRTNIAFSDVDHPPRRILVTSATPGEGKSTVAANLAVVLAQSGKRTLLIDAALRRPALEQVFGVTNTRGLTTLLSSGGQAQGGQGSAIAAVIVPAPGVANLALLPSGPLPPNPGDLLGSERMAALLANLAAAYEVLVIDSPPALAASDPLVLARQVDGVLLVVSAGETRAPQVRQAGKAIRQVGGRLLGVVLNKLAGPDSPLYYAYYESQDTPMPPGSRPPAETSTHLDGTLSPSGPTYAQDTTPQG